MPAGRGEGSKVVASGIEFTVLGPVAATQGGRQIVLDQQQRALLAALLVAFPHSVDIERLRAQVRYTRAAAAGNGQAGGGPDPLAQALEGLRGRLDDGGAAGSVLVRDGTRYQLAVPRDAVDAARFVDEVRRGDAMLAHAPDTAADAYREGLRQWRGLAYEGLPVPAFADTVFIESEVARLTERRFEARISLARAELDAGSPASAAVEAEAVVADHPLDERAWELLVLGLSRSGQQAQALAALRRCRATFDDRLGCEIGAGLRRMELALMTHDVVYLESAQLSPPLQVPNSNLIQPRTRLVDRERDVSSVMQLLDERRLVTLIGPSGVGKTRLAVEVCRRFEAPDGPWIVDLTKVSDGALIPSTIATLLALPGVGSPTHLAETMAARSCVLVLDNCKHVPDYTADVARAVLARCPDVRLIVTGWVPLGVAGEGVHEVAPLSVDGTAVELFSERAAGVSATWTLNEKNQRAVQAICEEVEGLPLGLELAAAQLRYLNEEAIADGLADRFTLLHGDPAPAIGPRGRMWDTIDWANRLMSGGEARLLRRISVFAGSFDVDGATAMCVLGSTSEVSVVLTSLVRRGLLRVVPGSSPTRYRMLATIRQFARDQADDAESIAIRATHRDFVLARVEAVSAALHTSRGRQAIRLLDVDQAEHRAALESAFAVDDGQYALDLAGRLAWFWYRTGNIGEGLQFLRTALDLVAGDWRPPEPRVMARALDGLASLTYLTGDAAGAEDAVRRGGQLWSSIGDIGEVARDEAWRAHFVAMQGRSTEAVELARHAVALAVDHDAGWIAAEARMVLGMLLRSVGEAEEARAELRDAIRVGERYGHRWAVTSSTWALMKAAADAGDVEGALATMRVLRADLDEEPDAISWLVMIHSTAAVLASAGRPADGAVLMGAVDTLGAQAGFLPAWIDAVDGPIEAAVVHGALDDEEYEQYAAQGAHLTREQVNRLVGELVEGPVVEPH
ncbi:putative ATPase/DNA-binding SARP family transcriptional activator [Prescottella agglutinans]|uniref:ATPase/DNA-binding SARP family transcriptional activator n=1 Tax=Prescottella agglutinans TaxID=1644129 RepID=A0ABT6MBG7_9NOCA|nr:putative ATPase/DNA-binding SARP family transcriptional activator [Prescottella agglutinans]